MVYARESPSPSGEMENGKWKMENYFLRWRLERSTERRNKEPLFWGKWRVRGLPRWVAYANKNAPRMAARGMIGVAEEYARCMQGGSINIWILSRNLLAFLATALLPSPLLVLFRIG